MKTVDIIISGRVQGVGFRYHTLKTALEFNIKGFVKNLPDGSVFVKATGNQTDLESFLLWCNQGPRLAMVEKLDIKETNFSPFDEFTIR
ncbi:MAG: acylphosphatase [Bacteroidales bacterium]